MSGPGDTIAAIATPPGRGGIAVVRVSGPDARSVVGRVFRPRRGSDVAEPWRVYLGTVLDAPAGRALDEALVFAMVSPHSYTGEDTVEIQCHGGSVISARVLEAVLAAGARPAQPGEFTKRAFLNGRLDLAQAEAVADVIAAGSDAAVRLARSQLEGHLSARIGALRDAIIRARARCEATIDFPEEDDVRELGTALATDVARVRVEIESLLAGFVRARTRYEGARVALVGKPNVGKSSLLNALAGRERAIVTPIAGTTRDVIEVAITLGETLVVLADTAGLRPTGDPVECAGVDRARGAIADAACALVVLDRSRPLDADDHLAIQAVGSAPMVVAVNKCDLVSSIAPADLRTLLGERPLIEVSAHTGAGVPGLADALRAALSTASDGGGEEVAIFRVRHLVAAQRAAADLARAESALAAGSPAELVATDLSAAASALGEITGEVTSEDVLDRVFAEFCIGK